MISQKKQLLAAGFSFAFIIFAAKPKPVEPPPPGDITQEGLHLNGPALNDQAIDTQAHPRELNPDTIQVEIPDGEKGHLSFQDGQLFLQLSE